MNKIEEIIVEPTKVIIGSTFLIKVKTINFLNYKEIKDKTYSEIRKLSYSEIKGV